MSTIANPGLSVAVKTIMQCLDLAHGSRLYWGVNQMADCIVSQYNSDGILSNYTLDSVVREYHRQCDPMDPSFPCFVYENTIMKLEEICPKGVCTSTGHIVWTPESAESMIREFQLR